MSGLRHGVVELLERRCLSQERLRALEALQQVDPPQVRLGPPQRQRFAWAIATLSTVVLPLLLWQLLSPLAPDPDMARLIAEEVATNHLHLKPLEVETDNIAGIRSYFNQLDFLPADSTLAMLDDLELLGARYCSIQGLAAAQLRLRQWQGGPVQTLYQAPYETDRFGPLPQLDQGELPLKLRARGLEVIIWVEKDILFSLIRES